MNTALLTKFLAGEASHQEAEQIEEWAQAHPDNQCRLQELTEMWNLSEKTSIPAHFFDADMDWAVLQNRIEDDEHHTKTRSAKRGRIFGLNTAWSTALRVAAIFVLASLAGLYIYKANYVPEKPEAVVEAMKEIVMSKGKRGGVTLSDGTKVYLNADSKLLLPEVFSEDIREVELEGEAYFDVAKNPNKPFIIKTKGAVVQVLGTSFVIKNYKEDEAVQAVVEHGVVSLRPASKPVEEGVILTKGKLGRLDLKNNRLITEEVENLDEYLSWKEGFLVFNNATMKEVAQSLERKYDVQVAFDSNEIKDLRLTADFKTKAMDYVLKTISTSLDIDYKIQEKRITFFADS